MLYAGEMGHRSTKKPTYLLSRYLRLYLKYKLKICFHSGEIKHKETGKQKADELVTHPHRHGSDKSAG